MDVDLSEHDSFVKLQGNSEILQSRAWARLKESSGRRFKLVTVGDGEKITASALLLFKEMPMTSLNMCIIVRGPVVDWDDKESLDVIIKEIIKAAKREKSISIKLLPDFLENESEYKKLLESYGFKHKGYTYGVQADIQPRHHMVTDISVDEKDLLNSFQNRTKTSIRKSLKNGLEFLEANDKIDIFYRLLEETSQRDGFVISDIEFIEKQIKYFENDDDAKIFLVKVNKDLAVANLDKDLKNKHRELARAQEKNEDGKRDIQIAELKNSIENTESLIDTIKQLREDKAEDIYLAGMLYLQCGDYAHYFFGASSNHLRDLLPNYFMQYKTMLYAKDHGCKYYDFGGVSGLEGKDNDPEPGLYEFKKRWGAKKISHIGEFDLVLKPFFKFSYDTAWNVKYHLRRIKEKITGVKRTTFYD